MSESGGIRAGAAYVEVFVRGNIGKELDKLAKKLKSFGDSITSIGKKIGAIGTAITAPLIVAAQQFSAMGSQMKDAADRTGIGVEALQEFKFAAEQTGASLEDVEGGIKKMSKAIFEAATGSQAARSSLHAIGLTVTDL